jgi:hypothetical protein
MKPTVFVIAGSLLVSSLAVAQPEEPPVLLDDVAPPAQDPPPPPPPPPPPTVVIRQEPAPAPPAPARPPGFSVGIGFGFRLPTELDLPNATSARFRLASGLTIEPLVALINDTLTADDGTEESEDVIAQIAVGAFVRYPLRGRGRADLALIGGAAVSRLTRNPDGDDNTLETTIFGLDYGLAVDYWLNSHWNLSVTATNPLVAVISQREESGGGEPDETLTRRQLALIFSPQVAVMLHVHL